MLSRLWTLVCYGIAAKLYLLTAVSIASLLVLATASIHFANKTKSAAELLYLEGVVGIQTVTQLELLFEQHRALITGAPAELDRSRLQKSRQAVEALNEQIGLSVKAERARGASEEKPLTEIVAQASKLAEAGNRVIYLVSNFAQDKALELSQGDYATAADAIGEVLRSWSQAQIRTVDREVNRLSAASSELIVWVLASALVAFILIGPVTLWTKLRIFSRLGKLTAVMRRLCNKELMVEVPYTDARDETGDIARTIVVFKENTTALGAIHFQLDAAINNMVQGLCMFDGQHKLVLCNDRFLEMFGLSRGAIVPGMSTLQVIQYTAMANGFSEEAAKRTHAAYSARLFVNGSDSYQHDFTDGRAIAVSRRKLPNGGWVDTHEDITERKKAENKIAYMAEYDTLTDLPNRNLFQRTLTEALEAATDSEQLAIFCLDLDGFKGVNDTFGHPVGDALLRQVARRLEWCVGSEGMVARLGGDEFAILQCGRQQPDGANALSRILTEVLTNPYDLNGNQAVLGASIGIAVSPKDASSSEELMQCVDMALYSAKGDGRGTSRFFEPEMNAKVKARRQLEVDLRAAIAEKQFEMFYQPIISVKDNQITAFEALIRWRHPCRGMVSPGEFIPVAEETGLIIPLGEWILRQVCADARNWPRNIRVAINLSPVQFRSPDLVQIVFSALASTHLEPGRLELEITETTLLQDNEAILEKLHQLKGFGIQISMDDFGTGYSSLSYLRSFPFDKIKIDQSFVRGLGKQEDSLAIIRAVISLGKNLEMSIIAEGVETHEQLRMLREERCDEVQGFLFSPAVSLQETHQLLGLLQSPMSIVA